MPVPKLSKSKEIKEEHVDFLVEELLGNNKKLTEAQQHKKRALETYLVHKTQQYDEESDGMTSSESDTEDSDSDSESVSCCECGDCAGTDREDGSATGSSEESESDSDDDSDSDSESGSSDDDTGTNSEGSYSESYSDSDYSKRSDEFTDEYTINSYSDEDY